MTQALISFRAAVLAAALIAAGAGCGTDGRKPAAAPSAAAKCTVEAPKTARVDLVQPTFSNPTVITNPRFPRGPDGQAVQLGTEAGERLRFEITYLPDSKVIAWNGQDIETRVTHFVAYKEGRILETALDFYAQDDAGNVWYFGEDVSNYENGIVTDHEGTWLAGRDGPPGMIMPAAPEVGDVYRPENIPGLVLEEVTVRAVDRTVDGPRGKVAGAIVIQECLMDGTIEDKQFAPGYGEFFAEVKSSDEVYRVAVALPADRVPGPIPAAIDRLGAAVATDDPAAMQTAADALAGETTPPLLLEQLRRSLDSRRRAVAATAIRQAAIDVRHAVLDLQLAHRPQADVDRARLALWADQLALDRAAADAGAVAGDLATIDAIKARIRP